MLSYPSSTILVILTKRVFFFQFIVNIVWELRNNAYYWLCPNCLNQNMLSLRRFNESHKERNHLKAMCLYQIENNGSSINLVEYLISWSTDTTGVQWLDWLSHLRPEPGQKGRTVYNNRNCAHLRCNLVLPRDKIAGIACLFEGKHLHFNANQRVVYWSEYLWAFLWASSTSVRIKPSPCYLHGWNQGPVGVTVTAKMLPNSFEKILTSRK